MNKVRINACPLCGSTNINHFKNCTDFYASSESFDLGRCEQCGFIFTHEFPDEKDKIFLDAFAQGYGQDIFNEKREILDAYILLRGFTRYPNPFELDLKEMMEEIIKKYHRL